MNLTLADPLPHVRTDDLELVLQAISRNSEITPVVIEHPDQLTLTSDFKTAIGAYRYSWNSLSEVCETLCPGLWSVVYSLSGRRDIQKQDLRAAVTIFNSAVEARFSNTSSKFLMTDLQANMLYRLTGSQSGRVLKELSNRVVSLIEQATQEGYEFFRGEVRPARTWLHFRKPGTLMTYRETKIEPVLLLAPTQTPGRSLLYRQGLRVNDSLLVKGGLNYVTDSLGTGRQRVRFADYNRHTMEAVESINQHIPKLDNYVLPGKTSDDLRTALYDFLRFRNVPKSVTKSCIEKLVRAQYDRNIQSLDTAFSFLSPDRIERTALDLLRVIAVELDSDIATQHGLQLLSRIGFALSVGALVPTQISGVTLVERN